MKKKLIVTLLASAIISLMVACSPADAGAADSTDISVEESSTLAIDESLENAEETNTEVQENTSEEMSSSESPLGYRIQDNILTYLGKDYAILEVDGGNQDGNREDNVAVDIGFGDRIYWGLTNEHGQLVYVLADSILLQDDDTEPVNSAGRYYDDEADVPGTEAADLDQGHVIADSLGGVANAYNITPQDSTLNRHGNQAYMEDGIRDAGGCSNFIATISYPNTSTHTPSTYKYEYTLMGNDIIDEFDNNNPEAIEESMESSTDALIVETDSKPEPTPEPEPTPAPSPEPVPVPEPAPAPSNDVSSVDTNGNGTVTIAEAETAGFTMPIYSDHWLYPYMTDADGDGMVGEAEDTSPAPTPEPAPVPEPAPAPSNDVSSVDTNGNGTVTIAEAEAAGFTMPIYSDHWLYPYMRDADGDGMVGE